MTTKELENKVVNQAWWQQWIGIQLQNNTIHKTGIKFHQVKNEMLDAAHTWPRGSQYRTITARTIRNMRNAWNHIFN